MKLCSSIVAALFLLTAARAAADEELADVNKPAPAFRLPVYNDKDVGQKFLGLDKFVGPDAPDKKTKVVLLSFMASFCGPCKKEMPYLQSLHDKYKDAGLRVVMVSIDKEEEGQAKIAELIATNKVTFPVLKDRFNIVARRWLGMQSPLPSLFLVKPDGVVSMVHRGYNDDASKILAETVEKTLKN